MGIQGVLGRILTEYSQAKTEAMKGHPLVEFRRRIESEFDDLEPVRSRKELTTAASFGAGNWARVPWIAFLDERETKSTQRGVYPVYLFRQDMSGVYLTFNQGVTEVRQEHGTGTKFHHEFSARKANLRPLASPLTSRGFRLDDSLDLKADRGLGKQYEISTVAYKFYPADNLPDDKELLEDLEAVLDVYDDFLAKKPELEGFGEESKETGALQGTSTFVDSLLELSEAAGLHFPRPLALAFQTGLACQPFTLLAGPTGTGKTQLALTLGQLEDFTVRPVEVEGGWLDSASAFGYVSPVTQDFVPGPVLLQLLDLLSEAAEESVTPVLLLDEINVSPPHIYLAPLLSTLERAASGKKTVPLLVAQSGLSANSQAAIRAAEELHPRLRVEQAGPFLRLVLDVPPNLRVVGTLNFDSSTEDLAPKLLSRSFVVWFEAPEIGADFSLSARSSYTAVDAEKPKELLAMTLRELQAHGYPVSARATRRSLLALDRIGNEHKLMIDILLCGLVLPQLQTLMEGQEAGRLREDFLEALPRGLFRDRLVRMREQLRTEGMANLWLIA